MKMIGRLAALGLALAPVPALATDGGYTEPYRLLQQANMRLDPDLAASAYTVDGALIFELPGQPSETFKRAQSIRSAYVRTFAQVDPGTPITLEFRFATAKPQTPQHEGVYRLKAKAGGREITAYGRFSVKLARGRDGWRFAEDRGTVATAADFDRLPPSKL